MLYWCVIINLALLLPWHDKWLDARGRTKDIVTDVQHALPQTSLVIFISDMHDVKDCNTSCYTVLYYIRPFSSLCHVMLQLLTKIAFNIAVHWWKMLLRDCFLSCLQVFLVTLSLWSFSFYVLIFCTLVTSFRQCVCNTWLLETVKFVAPSSSSVAD